MNNELIRKKIIHIREENRLRQSEVADKTNIDRSTYASLETGKRTISIKYLTKLTEFYNINLSYFIDDNVPINSIRYNSRMIYEPNIIHVIGRNGDKEEIKLTDEEYKKEFGEKPQLTDEEIIKLKKFLKNLKD